jgi:Uma2 family endonuclease
MVETSSRYKTISLEELMRLDDHVEVIDGEIVPQDMSAAGFMHAYVGANIEDILRPFVKQHRLGFLGGDNLTFVLHVHKRGIRTTRLCDVSFIRHNRFPKEFDPVKPLFFAPDLAIEVVSPGEPADELMAKINDYLKYGTEQVWAVYPLVKEVHQYFAHDRSNIRVYTEKDILKADEFFPALSIAVSQFFVPPDLGDPDEPTEPNEGTHRNTE